MLRAAPLCIVSLLLFQLWMAPHATAATEPNPLSATTQDLEQRLTTINAKLNLLADISLRYGSGSIGYRSNVPTAANAQEWVEINLADEHVIDEIVLVPSLCRDSKSGFRADAFPQKLRVWAGTSDNRVGTVVATIESTDGVLPRIAPLVIPVNPITASWIQVEALELSLRAYDQKPCLQLAEVMVFSGEQNVALRRPVSCSSSAKDYSGAWHKTYLTDGHTPYLMDSVQGEQSTAFLGYNTRPPSLTIDLNTARPVTGIHLHSVDQSDTVPSSFAGDLGAPKHLRVEGATQSDFSDATPLLDIQKVTIADTGPVMMWRIPETMCRYIRFTSIAPDPYIKIPEPMLMQEMKPKKSKTPAEFPSYWIGYAEIEVLYRGRNISQGATVSAHHLPNASNDRLRALTDGLNYYGQILPPREWMRQLGLRHDLEFERSQILPELNQRYLRREKMVTLLTWLAVVLVGGIIATIIVERQMHKRQLAHLKQRFAADLHDEIGANLHTINLLSELVFKRAAHLPEEVILLVKRIQHVTKRTNTSTRNVAEIPTASELYSTLPKDIKRIAERILIDLQHELEVEGEEFLNQIRPRRHSDLQLFYQECLINICRHSHATRVHTHLMATPREIHLSVHDNGKGIPKIPEISEDGMPPSLSRRAKLLGAKLAVEKVASGGTCVKLKLQRSWKLRYLIPF